MLLCCGVFKPGIYPKILDLVKNGYVERDGKKLRSTDKGRELITVVPDEVKSAKLTAEWESKLQQIEHGSLPESVFMSGIQQFVAEMCRKYGSADKSVTLSDSHEPGSTKIDQICDAFLKAGYIRKEEKSRKTYCNLTKEDFYWLLLEE